MIFSILHAYTPKLMFQFFRKPYPACICMLFCLFVPWGKSLAQLRADFYMDKTGGCSPFAVTFTNATTGASSGAVYQWDFGNGNTSTLMNGGAIYTDEKVYVVTLTVQDGANQSVRTQQVTVYSPPVVDFSASPLKGCMPFPVTFTSASSPGSGTIASYVWDFGDGAVQTGYSNIQSHTYTALQKPSVSLTLTNSFGCHTTIQKSSVVTVIPTLTSAFSADKRVLCLASDPVQFTNTSSGPGTLDYKWDFGDGNSSTVPNPVYAFNKKGIYTVTLTVHSSEGCTAVSTLANNLNVASYNTDFDIPSLICAGSYVSFQSKSTPTPDNTTWEVDGNTYNYYYGNFSYVFSTPGTHTVKLDNTFGTCPQSLAKQVVVRDIPHLNGFTMDLAGKCGAPAVVNFKDNTAGATAWLWDFDYNYYIPTPDAVQVAPSHTYTSNGQHNIYLQVSNVYGCTSSTVQTLQINAPFESIYLAGNGNWNSCNTPINANFAMNQGLVPVSSYLWNFGDGGTSTDPAPAHTFTNPGQYNVVMNYVDQNGCKGSTNSVTIVISKPVKEDFTANTTTICPGAFVNFNASPAADPNVGYWSWNFGDGSTTVSVGSATSHNYPNPGTYTVTLSAGNTGCNSTLQKVNYITVLPLSAAFTGQSNTCDWQHRGDVTFTANSSGASSLIWNFGDGTTQTTLASQTTQPFQTTQRHTYLKTGTYLVTLTAKSDQCTVIANTTAYVLLKQSPSLTASKTTACNSNDLVNIQITNLENDPYTNYSYSPYYIQSVQYQDGTVFNGLRTNNGPYGYFTIPYTGTLSNFNNGKQQLRVILTSAWFGCADTTNFIPLTIKGAAAAYTVTTDNVCYQSPVVLTDNSQSTSDNPIKSWNWNYGDGQSDTYTHGGTVSHTYANPGNYYASLQITDAAGCSSTTPPYAQYVNVDGPKASFYASGTNVPLNTTVYFYNTSNNYGSNNTVWQWDFGDGTSSTDYYPFHTYPTAGVYTVRLTATNAAASCSSSYTQVITVNYFNSAFSFNKSFVSGGCPPLLVNFVNTSVNYTRVTWDFGDGFTADNVNYPAHVYEKPGKYTITLNVYAPNGVQGIYTDVVNIPEPVGTMAADHTQACIGDMVNLTAKAANTNTYLWDFGDGTVQSSIVATDGHAYLTAGVYSPAVMMQDANGCSADTRSGSTVTIRPNPVITLNPDDPWICKGASAALQASGGTDYKWSPQDGLSNDAIAAPIASPLITTVYTLNITDDIGCRNSKTLTVTVIPPGNLQVSPDTSLCKGDQVQLHATGEAVYQWIGETDGLSDPNVADPVARPSVTTTYTVTGAALHSCFPSTAFVTIRVMSLPTVNAGQDVEMQVGETTQLNARGSSDIIKWEWTPATYLSCGNCPSPVCDPLISTTYVVTAINENTCHVSDTVNIKLLCEESRVGIPNAFTPNGDGVNDVFIIKGIAVVKHLVIYSRWGAKVFERNNFIAGDRSSCWNGTCNGEKCPSGTYAYFVEMECPSGGVFYRKGTVVLIR